MLRLVNAMIANMESSPRYSRSHVPQTLVELLEEYNVNEIGRFIVELKVNRVRFDFEVRKVSSAEEAFSMVKSSSQYGEKIYYALQFVSKMNNVASRSVRYILEENLGLRIGSEEVGV